MTTFLRYLPDATSSADVCELVHFAGYSTTCGFSAVRFGADWRFLRRGEGNAVNLGVFESPTRGAAAVE